MSEQRKHLFCFGGFELDLQERLLWKSGELIPLPPKQGEMLVFLVERGGGIVEKRELVSRLWPGINVGENNLSQVIAALRKTLGTAPDGRQYIENIPTRGYRFVGPPLSAEVDMASKNQNSASLVTASLGTIDSAHAIEVPDTMFKERGSTSPADTAIAIQASHELGKGSLFRMFVLSGLVLMALAVGYVLGLGRRGASVMNHEGAKWIKLPPVKISEYEFEGGEQGWTPGPNMMITHIFSSTEHAYRGKRSLAIVFDGPYSRRSQVFVVEPRIRPGTLVKAHVWCPKENRLAAIAFFVEDHSNSWSNDWRAMSRLDAGSWNDFFVQVPSDAVTPIDRLGVEFTSDAIWNGVCYLDSVEW